MNKALRQKRHHHSIPWMFTFRPHFINKIPFERILAFLFFLPFVAPSPFRAPAFKMWDASLCAIRPTVSILVLSLFYEWMCFDFNLMNIVARWRMCAFVWCGAQNFAHGCRTVLCKVFILSVWCGGSQWRIDCHSARTHHKYTRIEYTLR